MRVGHGHGKLILFGEHAAVYGFPAVGLRLDAGLDIGLEPSASNDGWTLPVLPAEARAQILAALSELTLVLRELGGEGPGERTGGSALEGGTLTVGGDLPMSVGFGSSAAFCTALLKAAHPAFEADSALLWRAAHRLERVFHGTPSGIDTGLSIHPGASRMTPSPPGLPERAPVELPGCALVVGAAPRERSTGDLIAAVRTRRERDADGVAGIMERLGSIASEVADGVDAATLGARADTAHEALASLGVSSAVLDTATDALRASGALGAKMSGAGGGGAFYGVFQDGAAAHDAADRVAESMSERGITLEALFRVDLSGTALPGAR